MDNFARPAGYAAVFGLLLVLGSALAVLRREAGAPARLIQVQFPEVGTLMADDPVVQSGVAIGRVRAIRPGQRYGVAEIEMFTERFLAEDSRFVNFNHSLMGARMIVVVAGRSQLPLDESRLQQGLFSEGVAETVHRVEDLLTLVRTLRIETGRLLSGRLAPLSAERVEKRVGKALAGLDGLARRADKAGRDMRDGALALTRASSALRQGLKTTARNLNPTWETLGHSLASTLAVEKSIDEALASMERLVNTLKDSTGAVGTHFHSRKAYDGMLEALGLLETALRTLKKEGLEDAIQFRRNIRVRGEKRR